MFLEYNNFIAEAKIADLKPGTRVVLKGSLVKKILDPETNLPFNLENKIAVVKSIGKQTNKQTFGSESVITFTLEEPIVTKIDLYTRGGKKVNMQMDSVFSEFKVNRNYFQNFEILTPEYLELQRKLKEGELTMFQSTKDFLSILKEIKFKRKGDYFDVSYFDIVKDNPDYASFVPSKKSVGEDFEKFRQQSKIGRIFRRLNPDLKDPEVEDFVNKYKAELETMLKGPEINVVTGEDISYWYHQKRYQNGGGTLNNSCMRYAEEQKSVRFYDNFPDKIALATYTKGGKLHARALIWRLDDGRVYMDRIYSVNAAAGIQLEKYAAKFKMLMYKNRYNIKNSKMGSKMAVTLESNKKMEMQLPYFDTFGCMELNKKDKKKDVYITKLDC